MTKQELVVKRGEVSLVDSHRDFEGEERIRNRISKTDIVKDLAGLGMGQRRV